MHAGSKWNRNDLTYSITKYPGDLKRSDTDDEVRKAFQAWSDITPLTFRKSSGKVKFFSDIKNFFYMSQFFFFHNSLFQFVLIKPWAALSIQKYFKTSSCFSRKMSGMLGSSNIEPLLTRQKKRWKF